MLRQRRGLHIAPMKDLGQIARQAFSVLVGQWAVIGYGVADTVMAGRHASSDLAALSIGFAIYISVFVGLMGVVQAILPIAGRLYGAGEPQQLGRQFRQSLYLAVAVSVLGVMALLFPGPLLYFTQAPPELEAQVRSYLTWLAVGFPSAVMFRLFALLTQAISRPALVTVLQIAGLVIKIGLNAVFMEVMGLGVEGCGMASAWLNAGFMVVAFALLVWHPLYRPFHLFSRFEPPAWHDQKELLRLGIPMGLSYFIEVTATTFMALFIARFGATALAGHQIVVSVGAMVYMVPLSIGIAASAVVSQRLGAGEPAAARKAGYQGIALGAACAIACGVVVYGARALIVGIYTSDPQVAFIATPLMIFIAVYQIADATQVTTAFVLRAYKIAVLPMVLYAVALWGVGLGGGWLMAFNASGHVPAILHGPAGFWMGNVASLALVAVLLQGLYARVSRTTA